MPGLPYPHAACLSTVAADGWPEGRIILVHGLDDFEFFLQTDSRSPKAQALVACPKAALTFHWQPLERQVRITGTVEEAPSGVADSLFEERPRCSRVPAWASEQSRPLRGEAELEAAVARLDRRFEGQESIPRPEHWRAYRLEPASVELWQARARRLHLRWRWRRPDGEWRGPERLFP